MTKAINNREHKRHYRMYGNMVAVLCKCPFCGETHLVNMAHPPVVMPRIYCPEHKYFRSGDADTLDVRGTSLRSNTEQKRRRANA